MRRPVEKGTVGQPVHRENLPRVADIVRAALAESRQTFKDRTVEPTQARGRLDFRALSGQFHPASAREQLVERYFTRLERGKLGGASVKPCTPGCTATPVDANHARFAFLDPRAQDFWIDWERAENDTVGVLRGEAGRNPYDKTLSALVGELSMRSEDFRTRWAAHNVYLHRNGTKLINHPIVGRLELMYDALPADRRHRADDARLHRRAR